MKCFIRVKLGNVRTGAFIANGLFVKTDDNYYFVTDNNNIALPAENAVIDGIAFTSETSPVHIVKLEAEPSDSFVTLALCVSDDAGICGTNYIVTLDDHVIETNDVFNYSLTELFAVAQHEASIIGGVAIKAGYTQTQMYSGFGSYHLNQRIHRFNTPLQADKPWRIGIELELYAKNQAAYNAITGARSNWFQCEADSSLNQAAYPIEMKTIPLKACDAHNVDFWDEPMARLKQLANSKSYTSTGLHVHIGREILGDNHAEQMKTLDKLLFFYTYLLEDVDENNEKNIIICGRAQGYNCQKGECKTEMGDIAKELGMEALTKSPTLATKVGESMRNRCESHRGDINIRNLDSYGTIEFRKGKGIIGKTRIAGLVTWWEQMCLYCRNTPASDLSFNDFFTKVCRENPCVSYFFQRDEEQ